jgi:hypothetical protein
MRFKGSLYRRRWVSQMKEEEGWAIFTRSGKRGEVRHGRAT